MCCSVRTEDPQGPRVLCRCDLHFNRPREASRFRAEIGNETGSFALPQLSQDTGFHTDGVLWPLLLEIWKTSEGWAGQAVGGKFIFLLLRM